MKKIFSIMALMTAFAMSANAQKGMKAIGVDATLALGNGSCITIGPTIKYQYNISDYFRIEPAIGFYPIEQSSDDENFNYLASLSGHIFFQKPNIVRPYLELGLGLMGYHIYTKYGSSGYYQGEERTSENTLGALVGLGLDYRLSYRVSMQAGIKGFIDFDGKLSGILASLGLVYNF